MFNQNFSKLLNEIGDLLELNNDNVFRIRAFRRAAETIESLPSDFSQLDRAARLEIPGIGKGIADIAEEFIKHGRVVEMDKLKKKYPQGVLDIMHLPGLGPKRAAQLLHDLKIDSVEKLGKAATKGELAKLDRFGEKLQANILKNISFAKEASKRIIISDAWMIANDILAHLKKSSLLEQPTAAGSTRRWKETVGDLDFLCTSKTPDKAIAHFLKYADISRTLAEGGTKASVVLKSGLQCDFRVVDPQSFGAALLYFTGSQQHNIRLRELALKKGLTLNEYGLFKENYDKNGKSGAASKVKPIVGKTEEEIYKHLGLPWIPPELREDRGEIEASLKNKLPRLVTEQDVLGDFHNHTKLSDGAHSLEEMVDAARRKKWKWFFSGDHSPSLKVASGLPVPVLKNKMARVKALDKASNDIRVFCGSEVDILAHGELDYPDDTLNELDCVVGSVHSRFNEPEDVMTERICNALRNKHLDILGHLSGRLINKRPSYAINIEKIMQTAKETGSAIEVNGQPERQELNDVQVRRAIELGIPLALTTDAHSTSQLDHMTLAVHIARRGWAEAKDVLNSYSAKEILHWLKTHK